MSIVAESCCPYCSKVIIIKHIKEQFLLGRVELYKYDEYMKKLRKGDVNDM